MGILNENLVVMANEPFEKGSSADFETALPKSTHPESHTPFLPE